MKIALIGFGVVGQGFVEILRDKSVMLRETYGFSPMIVSVATRSKGVLSHPEGLDPTMLLESVSDFGKYPTSPGLIRQWGVDQIVTQSNADVVIEMTVSNLETGQPALDYVRAALGARKHVVLANKGPVALALNELRGLAATSGVQLRYEATVMAGTPSLQLAGEALAGCRISRARGILNGTTNYILTQMEAGMSYADALAQAQAKGYAEADPTADVGGWDAAGKVLILANTLFGQQFAMSDLDVTGITEITLEEVQSAVAVGERWKLIADVSSVGGKVAPVRLSMNDPLAGVAGSKNAITYTTDLLGDVTLVGAGAGRHETGFAILADLLALHKMMR